MFTRKQLKIELVKHLIKVLAFVVISSAAIYIFSGQIAKIGQAAKQNRTAVSILEKKNELAAELKNDLLMIGDGDKKVREAFIKADDIVGFVNNLEEIAKNNSFEQTLKFGNPIPDLNDQNLTKGENEIPKAFKLLKVEYDIALKGNVQAFSHYLEEFEKLPYFTNISSIVITSSPVSGTEEQSSISVKAQLYITQ